MWIIPRTYLPSSLTARDMLESKEDLTSPALNIESSLMWRSKPTQLRTWLQRWKRVNWSPLLFGRILKPSRRDYFEELLTSSLAATRVSRFLQQADGKEKRTLDTYGPTSARLSGSYDPDAFSLRMWTATLVSDLTKSSPTWKRMVTERRGTYSRRVKSALRTNGNESTSWATPQSRDFKSAKGVKPRWEDPARSRNLNDQVHTTWPTASARDWKDSSGMAREAVNPDGSRRKRTDQLARAVYAASDWPTPGSSDGKNRCSNHGMAVARKGSGKQVGLETKAHLADPSSRPGALNPDWVEWLMGVPEGWTSLYRLSSPHYGWPLEPPIPRVTQEKTDRVDRIRLLGNGVVPQTAALAWETLSKELET